MEADGKADGTDLTEERNILVMRFFSVFSMKNREHKVNNLWKYCILRQIYDSDVLKSNVSCNSGSTNKC